MPLRDTVEYYAYKLLFDGVVVRGEIACTAVEYLHELRIGVSWRLAAKGIDVENMMA